MKKLLCTILSAILMLSTIPAMSISVSAVETEQESVGLTSGIYEYTLDSSGNATITAYHGIESNLTIPSYLDGHKVTGIADKVFERYNTPVNVTIPDTVTTMGQMVFNRCPNLTTVKLSENLTSMGEYVFNRCPKLKSINIPASLATIPFAMLNECESLTSITIPNGVKKIDEWAFAFCTNLKNVSIANSVTEIGVAAFKDCTSLESITLPTDLKVINKSCFANCTSLKTVNIQDNLTSIYRHAFSGCTALKSITLPKSFRSIDSDAFYNSGLTDIYYNGTKADWDYYVIYGPKDEVINNATIHYSTNKCGNNAVYEIVGNTLIISGTGELYNYEYTKNHAPWYNSRSEITKIVINDGITSIGDFNFHNLSKVTNVQIADTVETIGVYSFYNCANLTDVKMSDSIEIIGDFAFLNCSKLKTITNVGKSLELVLEGAFSVCTSLSDVYFNGTQKDWNNIDFDTLNENLTNATIHFAGSVKLGDVTLDGQVSIDDATLIQKYLAESVTLTKEQMTAADVTKDGNVTVDDVTKIQKYVAEMISSL